MTVYLLSKTIHIIGIISWMAGLFYLYRLFIYHVERGGPKQTGDPAGNGKNEIHELLSLMEKRLYRIITFPAMCISVGAGFLMVFFNRDLLTQPWFHIKLTCGLAMMFMTFYGGYLHQRFKHHKVGGFTGTKLRILNEVPTFLMIVIIMMVIFRPMFH